MDQNPHQLNENKPKTATGADYEANRGVYSTLRDYSSKGKKKRFWFF